MMMIDDFIMLGRTVPEDSKTYGKKVCSAGYSRQLKGFVRVYPLTRWSKVRQWSICRIALRRNNKDSRGESWRLNDEENESITITGKTSNQIEYDFFESKVTTIKRLNEKKASLGIIKPTQIAPFFKGKKPGSGYTIDMFSIDEEENDYSLPMIDFNDDDSPHKLQVREWGCHEWMRKGGDPSKLWGNLKLSDPNYEHLFFVGNMSNRRNVWLIISLIYREKISQGQLF